MKTVDVVCDELDAALGTAGFRYVGGPFIARRYETSWGGRPLRATVSIEIDPGSRHRGSTLLAMAYHIAFELENGLSTRWIAASFIPVLTGVGLSTVCRLPSGAELRVDDVEWTRARFGGGEGGAALDALCARSRLVEQRPGLLQFQMHRVVDSGAPDVRAELEAFAAVARSSAVPPAPRPTRPRFTDNRTAMMVLLTVVVVGPFAACVLSAVALGG